MDTLLEWEDDFPEIYGHTAIAYLKHCPGFKEAKNGNLGAAQFLVNGCVKQDRLAKLRKRYPDAYMLSVLCKNQLPLALAQKIGLPIWHGVRLFVTISRKYLGAMQKLLQKPVFIGVVYSNIDYILVDDVVTQGGTIAELRRFVLINGGKVAAIVALTYSIGSQIIALTENNVVQLMFKFGLRIVILL